MKKDLTNNAIKHISKKGVEYLQFKRLSDYSDNIRHCISTRIGGVGNPTVAHSEPSENTRENFKMLCEAAGMDYRNLVFSNQVHQDTIRIVGEQNRGEGILRPREEEGCDGLVTNSPDTVLVTFFADCVPVLFYDYEKKVIGSCHAGWRGTVKKVAQKTARLLIEKFQSNPENIIACIGPSIGPCCFEVNEPVAMEFKNAFGSDEERKEKIILPAKSDLLGKFNVNLWQANIIQLVELGLKRENIISSGICTSCNNDVLYSYRAENGKTGRIYTMIQLLQ